MNNQPTQFLAQTAAFWREQLQGFTAPTALAVERTTGSSEPGRGCQPVQISPAVADAILVKQHLDPAVVLVGLWGLLLHRYSGETDVTFGIQFPREPAGNPVPLRLQVAPERSLLDWLSALQAQWVALQPHRQVSLEQIQQWGELPEGQLFESVVYFADAAIDPAQIPSDYPLTLLAELSASPTLWIHYDLQTFEAATIARLAGHLQTLLEGMVTQFDRRVAEQPLLTVSERHQILVEWNSNQVELPQQCIHQLFEAQVERTPDAIALIKPAGADSNSQADCQKLTYRELNQRAERLALRLKRLGVQPGVFVAIQMKREIDLIVALLGVLKAGGAYVPIDPGYPPERIAWMLTDAQAPILLTQTHLVEQLPRSQAQVICVDAAWEAEVQPQMQAFNGSIHPTDLAYVNYTSGSTGRPKGVAVLHRAVVRLVRGNDYARLDAHQTLLQLAPISFDAATFEIWGALLNGGCCVLYPEQGIPDPPLLKAVIQTYRVTTLWLTAALFNTMIAEAPEALCGIKELLTGGEALSVSHIRQAQLRLPETQLINGYGPTEGTTFTCCYRIPAPLGAELTSVPIGRPISNTEVYVLDAYLQPVPIGVMGELYIGGLGLAQGYINRPDLTQKCFIPHPFCADRTARLYKTGDQVRYLPDGTLQFLGRKDNQVKIRGYRVELGEIEAALERHESVRDAVVLQQPNPSGEKSLVAYVTPGAIAPQVSQLRADLQQRLPDYMVPAIILILDSLPLTPTGKVDRAALPPPALRTQRSLVAAGTAVEKALAEIWCGVLGLEQIGIEDNFFDVGGTSLLGMRMMTRVQQQFNVQLRAVKLYEYPTIRGLAQALSQPAQPTVHQNLQSRAQRQKTAQARQPRRA